MATRSQWVFLAYRLPREPSTPRITLWRKLKRLGVAQVLDGLVALPLDARNREQLEWLADEILEADGHASIWTAQPTTARQERELVRQMQAAIELEYDKVIDDVSSAIKDPSAHRAVSRLRAEMRRIRRRDYFPSEKHAEAREAVEQLARALEAAR